MENRPSRFPFALSRLAASDGAVATGDTPMQLSESPAAAFAWFIRAKFFASRTSHDDAVNWLAVNTSGAARFVADPRRPGRRCKSGCPWHEGSAQLSPNRKD